VEYDKNMSLICVTGNPDVNFFNDELIRGNGKTATVTDCLARDHIYQNKIIFTNYWTDFSEKMDTFDILDKIQEDKSMVNISIGLDEFQEILTSLGEPKKKTKYIRRVINQSRKKQLDIYITAPCFKDINNRIREATDIIIVPKKFHVNDNSRCYMDNCMREHYITIFSFKPFIKSPIRIFNPKYIGKHYNTYEIINENIDEHELDFH
jgi:hypothetical protein